MPPKKRTAAKKSTTATSVSKRPKRGAKTVEEDVEEEEVENEKEIIKVKEEEVVIKDELKVTDSIITKLKEADKNNKKPKIYLPDKNVCGYSSYSVHLDYDCMLNQTNIGHNNNKFYVIQVLTNGSQYYLWNRWGRVGETGQNNGLKCFGVVSAAVKEFEKKFKEKTKNDWNDRASFTPVPVNMIFAETLKILR